MFFLAGVATTAAGAGVGTAAALPLVDLEAGAGLASFTGANLAFTGADLVAFAGTDLAALVAFAGTDLATALVYLACFAGAGEGDAAFLPLVAYLS